MTEKNFFLSIKKQLPKGTFIQKIENKFNSGFPDIIIINEKFPLFIELKSPTKGNIFKVEPSQIATHLRPRSARFTIMVIGTPSTGLMVTNGIVS